MSLSPQQLESRRVLCWLVVIVVIAVAAFVVGQAHGETVAEITPRAPDTMRNGEYSGSFLLSLIACVLALGTGVGQILTAWGVNKRRPPTGEEIAVLRQQQLANVETFKHFDKELREIAAALRADTTAIEAIVDRRVAVISQRVDALLMQLATKGGKP